MAVKGKRSKDIQKVRRHLRILTMMTITRKTNRDVYNKLLHEGFEIADIKTVQVDMKELRNDFPFLIESKKDANGTFTYRKPIHNTIDSEIAAFFDPFGNAVHTALSYNIVGEDVLITGAGPIGIMCASICKFVGARNVVITDINEYRLDLAEKLGATKTINISKEKIKDCFKELNINNGFDVGLEVSGNPSAFNNLLSKMYNGGNIALLGLLPKSTQINWDDIIFKGLHIKGIYGREMYETWYKMTQILQSGLDISGILTHELPVDDFQKAFDIMESGQCGKVVLKW